MTLKVAFSPVRSDLDIQFSAGQEFAATLEVGEELEVDFGAVSKIDAIGIEPYKGDYEVTPKLNSQTLETAQKYMTRDVEVKQIPIYSVSNNSGGKTVTIG